MSKMKKTDYELVADAIYRSRMVAEMDKNRTRREAKLAMLRLVVSDLVGTFRHDNSKFDQDKFTDLCGIQIN